MPDLIQFAVSPQDDPTGREVRAILEAHIAVERTKAARQFWVHLLAAVGGLIALCMVFPQAGSEQMREALLALWGACCVCALAAGGLEWRWHHREAQLLAANKVTPAG
ncbi:MAG TPA: hypothetical protein VF515_08220 [Candidatus Binatia bacterium]